MRQHLGNRAGAAFGFATVVALISLLAGAVWDAYQIFGLGLFDPKFGNEWGNLQLVVYLSALLAGAQLLALFAIKFILSSFLQSSLVPSVLVAAGTLSVLNIAFSPLQRGHPVLWAVAYCFLAVLLSATTRRQNAA